jgi:hypothetical protein
MITDFTMGNIFSSNTPLLSSMEGVLGTYMKDLLMVLTRGLRQLAVLTLLDTSLWS